MYGENVQVAQLTFPIETYGESVQLAQFIFVQLAQAVQEQSTHAHCSLKKQEIELFNLLA